jgi:hypothetical protein
MIVLWSETMVNQQKCISSTGAARWVPTHSRLLQISESIYNLSGVRITVKHKARDFDLHSPSSGSNPTYCK